MKYMIKRAVVIGSGTMGAAIAAHLANAGVPVTLLDIVPNTLDPQEAQKGLTLQDRAVRNRIVQQGLERAIASRPASFFSWDHAALVKVGNLEDDFDCVGQADWIIEAIVENLSIKRRLMERIDHIRLPGAIVSTNTSGLPVASIAEGRSDGFRQHFLGTHFFNPPRYLKLLEIIPTAETLPAVTEFISFFGEYRLGKGIVNCKDTPNFIGNRIAFGQAAFALDYILENGYTVEEVDAITGPIMGRPKTATFRLIDLVGIDVWDHVGRNLAPAIPHDLHALKYLKSERVNSLMNTLLERHWLGTKSKVGFYKEVRAADDSKEFWPLDLQALEHKPPQKVRFDSIGKARDKEKLADRLQSLLAGEDRAAQLARALTYQGLAYASECIPEVADSPVPIDDAMRWGFGNDAGPFEIWDMLGVAECAAAMKATGFPPAAWVGQMLEAGIEKFYQKQAGQAIAVYHPASKKYQPIPRPAGVISLSREKAAGKLIKKNAGASLIDLGDGVAFVEFHAKMNILDDDTYGILIHGMDVVEKDFDALVVGTESDHFSAGANLFLIVMLAQNGQWDELEQKISMLQQTNLRARYFPKPVVVAPVGYDLGGGAELTLHASRVVAGAELYTGLVEIGMGLIPAGGGTKEMVRRLLNPAMRTKNTEALPFLQRIFEQVGMGKVATSAEEARQMGILNPQDRVVMNREYLIAEAKREALHMSDSGYAPPMPEKIYAAGRDSLSALRVGIYMMKEGCYITEYEAVMANRLANVMTGGELSQPTWVDEQYILDLEREAFLALCGEEKTRQRIWTFLQTGKRIRN